MRVSELCELVTDQLNVKRLSFLIGTADDQPLFVCYASGRFFFRVGDTDRPPSPLAEEVMGAVFSAMSRMPERVAARSGDQP